MKIVKIQMSDLRPNYSSLGYCRKLLTEGESPKTRLEVYREEILCLSISEIGKGAELTVIENDKEGPRFIKYRPFPKKLKGIEVEVPSRTG